MFRIWGRTSKAVFACVASISFIGASAANSVAPAQAIARGGTSSLASAPNLVSAPLDIQGAGPTPIGEPMPISEAIDIAGTRPILNANPGTDKAELSNIADDPDAYVDQNGKIFYADAGLALDGASAAVDPSAIDPEVSFIAPADETFDLQSRPGSLKTLYLDFNGETVTGTAWNTGVGRPASITAPAMDRDGDPTSFNDYELAFIQTVWRYVAEDYAPFDINVTTRDPGPSAYIRSDSSDQVYGAHAVITNSIVGAVCPSCAGVAYTDVFGFSNYWYDSGFYQPAWNFSASYGAQYASVTISHEVGHNFGLNHDGLGDGSGVGIGNNAYFSGQGSWAPIMGGGASNAVHSWSNGDYANASQHEDDTAIIAQGAPLITDDYADTIQSATTVDPSTPISGVISTRADEDVFKINATAGTLHLRASSAPLSPNLDIKLELKDAAGNVLASHDPAYASVDTTIQITKTSTGMGAWLDYVVASDQTLYAVVSGVGSDSADPTVTGYSDYGSLGAYTFSTEDPTLTLHVDGPGHVTSAPSGISSCTSTCSHSYTPDTDVTLTATGDGGGVIAYWTGACEATTYNANEGSTCVVPMDQAREVTAVFRAETTLSVTKVGSGAVTDSSVGWYISCGATCSSTNWRASVTLTATPSAGYVFSKWAGACTTESVTCTIAMTSSKSVQATFVTASDMSVAINGSGSVTSDVSGIDCAGPTLGTPCTHTYSADSQVVLTATAADGKSFAGWSGACTGVGTCTVSMNAARSVTATFVTGKALNIAVVGDGTITSSSGGVNCVNTTGDSPCTAGFSSGTSVTLSAAAGTGYVFTGWSGDCSGTSTTCALTMSATKAVTATFAAATDITVGITGSGSVTSSPLGMSCTGPTGGSSCVVGFAPRTEVTLTASPAAGYLFKGWSGYCVDSSTTCVVYTAAAHSVSAEFISGNALSVSVAGAGNVSSDVGGVSCDGPTHGTPCTHTYAPGTEVVLTATATYTSTFTGWSGACTGTGTCTVTMSTARSVTATFDTQYLLAVSLSGGGDGSVVTSGQGINCQLNGYSCFAYYDEGSQVVLTAVDGQGFFTGWSGDCSGTARTCTVTIDDSNSVTAGFEIGDSISLPSTAGGTISASKGWITCGFGCSGRKPSGSTVALTAVPDPGYMFGGWSNGCSGLGTCSYTGSEYPFANFVAMSPIDAGNSFTCRALSGSVKCWGANASGQLGTGTNDPASKPQLVKNLSGVAAVSTGGSHACAVLNTGTVKCWGENGSGQLGNNATSDAKSPVTVSGLSDVQTVEAGSDHTCALLDSGIVKCWGNGANGRLGNGKTSISKTPVVVSGIGGSNKKAVAISAGGSHTCALLTDATVKCWGANASGQLGNGSLTDAKAPVSVSALSGARGVSTGGSHTCALLSGGTVKCWGLNSSGQLGNGTFTTAKTPVAVTGLTGSVSVSAGSAHTCATAAVGFFGIGIKCWGAGGNGRLGNGATLTAKTPVSSTNTTTGAYVSAGGSHTCAVITSGAFEIVSTYKCWGAGTFGQIGNNKFADSLVAVNVL